MTVSSVFWGAPNCNIVLQHGPTPSETPHETLFGRVFGSLLFLWFLALVLTGCCQLACIEFGVLRCPCILETGRLENTYKEKKLAPSRARRSTWPFPQRKLLSCTHTEVLPLHYSVDVDESLKTPVPVYTRQQTQHVHTHAYAFNVRTAIQCVHHRTKS